MTCTFFGHRDTTKDIEEKLKVVLLDLILNKSVTRFLVGYQGNFDRITLSILKEIKKAQPHIEFEVVLAYLSDNCEDCPTIYPEGLENVPKRFAISARNKWMIDKSDFVVTCVCRSFGGAAQFKELAIKKGKRVIELLV